MDTLLIPAILDGYNPKKDKSVTIRFNTQEQTPEAIMKIHALLETFGYLYFKPEDNLTATELKELDSMDTDLTDGNKTQSKRIKNVLYVNWQQVPEGYADFKDYYKAKTEHIIQHFKDKLDT